MRMQNRSGVRRLSDIRARLRGRLTALMSCDESQLAPSLARIADPDAAWNIAHPVNQITGIEAIVERYWLPIRRSLGRPLRRDEIFLGGESRTGSGLWVAALGHYTGLMGQPLFGIAPNGRLVFLRYGEFYRLQDERIVEARILLDLVDLLRQLGRMPLPQLLGSEMLFPAPATHDGVLPDAGERSAGSAALVEAMLKDLRAYDPTTFASRGQTGDGGYWHPQMMWYGPAGIGATQSYPGFDAHHRVAFLKAFPDRVGGNHYARFGDGDYVASGGWPSLTATHQGDYLGVAATGHKIGMRVMDFWRCGDGQIEENWVLIDMPDLFLQLGVDLLADAGQPA